jgi:hypothetical protein
MNPLVELIRGAPTPWCGERIDGSVDETLQFDRVGYPIRMQADADQLVWSIPRDSAPARGEASAFQSRLERYRLRAGVEVWRFPKLGRQPQHEVVLFVDRSDGTVASLEMMMRPAAGALRADVKVVRGVVEGYRGAYSGFAFPRWRPPTSGVELVIGGRELRIGFDRSGQPAGIGRAPSVERVTGHALAIAPSCWTILLRSRKAASLVVLDELRPTANLQLVSEAGVLTSCLPLNRT